MRHYECRAEGVRVKPYRAIVVVLSCCWLAACMYKQWGAPESHPVMLTWEAVTVKEADPVRPVTYNIYAVPGAGPIPTEVSNACGATLVAKGRPLNSEPIHATSYGTNVMPGMWTFAVEAVSANGCRSEPSSHMTVTIPIRKDSSTSNITIEP
jgi:hypothetical protein